MSNDQPPDPAASGGGGEPTPIRSQRQVIESDAYPMRVLAGAGTGKTFTMVRKIERLIEAGTPPDRILALTFTNKAADAMQRKLVEKVGPAGQDIQAYTYHAVCHEILQEYAYHADIDPRYEVATDADRLAIVYDVLDAVPYRFTNPDIYTDTVYAKDAADRLLDFIQVMKRAGIRPATVRTYLEPPARLIELDGIVDRINEGVETHLRVNWRSMSAERFDEIRRGLAAFETVLADEHDGLGSEGVEGDIAAYLSAMREVCGGLDAFFEANAEAIIAEEIPAAQKLPAYLFGSYGNAPTGMPPLEYDLPSNLAAFIERCQAVSDLVAGYDAYQRRLREENLLDFNDLVLETLAILNDESITDWITAQHEYVCCDEFQDTDTIQFDLVRQLAVDERLFVVGDDDQAIYEWRGANSDNIGPRLTDTYPDITDQHLQTNFRSRQPILDLANNALTDLDDRGSTKTLTAHGNNQHASTGVFTITGTASDDRAGDDENENEDEEETGGGQAVQIGNAITRLLNGETDHTEGSYAPGDVAVLVRKKKHATPIVEELRARGIPYELAGDLAGESIGVETVVAGLKAIADPRAEVSLNRLLRMRYRLHEDDLRQLNTDEESESLKQALLTLPREVFVDPDPVMRAREDLSALWTVKSSYSLSRLYRELKDRLNLEWFLTAQERRDVEQFDNLIASFEDGPIEPDLSGAFVEYLSRHGSIAEGSTRSMEDQPEPDAAAVSIMTIHKSKGLEFPVVILPRLEADEWSPRARPYDQFEHAVTVSNPLDADFVQRDLQEARRLLHVGITRAADHLIMVGRHDDETGDDDGEDDETMSIETIETVVGDAVPWSATGVLFPIWETIQSSLPPSAVDVTDTLAQPVDTANRTAATDDGQDLTRTEARERVFDLARAVLDGELAETASDRFAVDPDQLAPVDEPQLQRRHSYTAFDTLETCTRQHYLNYVVRAYDDPVPTQENSGEAGVSQRIVGVLFHETAERAVQRDADAVEDWRAIARQLAASRGHEDALSQVDDCIDRYFECEVADWDVLAAERAFELDIAGETIVGKIDAVCRRPDGDRVVIDYKATQTERSLDSDLQLPIYLLACQELFDDPITTAGYAYVGAVGPAVDTRVFTDDALTEARDEIRDRLEAANASSYDEYTAGDHCQWCPHRNLECSAEITSDD